MATSSARPRRKRAAALFAVFAPFAALCAGTQDILVCNQNGQAIEIYDASGSNVWRWTAKDDPTIPDCWKAGFADNVAESKPVGGGAKIGMVSCGGRWAIIDRETRKADAWGINDGWSHSIETIGNDVVAVVSTGGTGGNSLFLFDISGDAAKNPDLQGKSVLKFNSPHGLHWDGKWLWLVDRLGLHRCRVARRDDGAPGAEVDKTWEFKPLGVINGHDLRPVSGSMLLAMTTHEKVLFFDMGTEKWREDLFVERQDVKAFDPSPDGKSFLSATAKTKWWTDTLELCDPWAKPGSASFSPLLAISGARIYKARWMPRGR